MMTKNNCDKKTVSVLQGDGKYFGHILSRAPSSTGRSSHIYYRRAEGVPFNWEMLPGTPKDVPEEEMLPPLSPPPSVLSAGFPKPRVDQIQRPQRSNLIQYPQRSNLLWNKIRTIIFGDKEGDGGLDHHFGVGESDGDFGVSSDNACSSSSLTYSSTNSHIMELSNVKGDSFDGPFCCGPWNITAILDEENTKVYYCREHKTAFTIDKEERSLVSKMLLTSSSSVEEQSFRSYYRSSEADGDVPFGWEMQPGTPVHQPETEVIPPPCAPPAVQSSSLPLPNFHLADHDEESVGNAHASCLAPLSPSIWKFKGLSELSRIRRNLFSKRLCFMPRTFT